MSMIAGHGDAIFTINVGKTPGVTTMTSGAGSVVPFVGTSVMGPVNESN